MVGLLSHLLLATAAAQAPREGGAPYVHDLWTVEDGLPVNTVNQLLQAPNGYLWLATFDGLVRFDGVRFTVFNTGNSDGLPSNRIVGLHLAPDSSLLVRTEHSELLRFKEGRFFPLGSATGITVDALHTDPNGDLWIGMEGGLGKYEKGTIRPIFDGELEGNPISIYSEPSGSLWLGTDTGHVYRLDDGGLTHLPLSELLDGQRVVSLARDVDGALWIGTDEGVWSYNDRTFQRFEVDGAPLHASVGNLLFSSDTLWIGTNSGLFIVHGGGPVLFDNHIGRGVRGHVQVSASGNRWIAVGRRLYKDGRLVLETTSLIGGFLLDREGSVWIATERSGLHQLKPGIFTVYSVPEGLRSSNVYPVLEDREGAVWIGTFGGGLSRLKNGVISSHQVGDLVRSLYEDRSGTLWVGLWGGGAFRLEDDKFVPFGTDERLRTFPVQAIHEFPAGTMWFGSFAGLFRHAVGRWSHFTTADGLAGDRVRVFLETRDGSLWMGSDGGGLTRFRDGEFAAFTTAQGLSSDLIRALYEDEDGLLWVGTEGRGLNRIDFRGGEDAHVTVYREGDGLFDEVIHQILEDDFGRLWMSTNRGIFWIMRAELNAFAEGRVARIHATSYTERHGLRNREANGGMQPAGIRARDGRLWFPTQDGVAVVDPSQIQSDDGPPPVVIEEVRTGGEDVLLNGGTVTLAAGQRDFEITYTALSFLAPENMRFRYRIDGFDSDWVDAGSRRVAYYTNMPPGRFTFRVAVSNNDGVWSEEGAALAFVLTPFFHETSWFWLMVAFLLVGAGASGYRLRVRRLERRQEELAALVDTRTEELRREQIKAENQALRLLELDNLKSQFFANVSHEFRTPLTLTIGPLEDLQAGFYGPLDSGPEEQVELALRNARRLLRLINELLDLSKLEAGEMRLHLRSEDVASLLRSIASAFASLAERRQIRFRLELPDLPVRLHVDPDQLEKIFTNLLANAFKFTPEGGTVSLRMEVQPNAGGQVRISIRDNGPGIPDDKLAHIFERFYQVDEAGVRRTPGTGIGLSLARELAQLHGGDILVDSEEGFGTTFHVILPISTDAVEDSPEASVAEGDGDLRSAQHLVDSLMVEADRRPERREDPVAESEDVTTVLVVDDNADVRAYIRSHLAARYAVVEAADGAEGLAIAKSRLPDLIISDVMMPGTDGHALCRALKQDPELDCIPIILLTAKATSESRVEGYEEGADDYLTKPFNALELEARVDNLIASRQHLRRRFSKAPVLQISAEMVDAPDGSFLTNVQAAVEAGMGQSEFGVEALALTLNMSRTQLYRRIREVLDQSPVELIRSMRLERAAQLLRARAGTVSEIGYAVGFNSLSYFARCFRERFQVTPSRYGSAPEN